MEQIITRWTLDEEGEWVAHLACGHRQHVRHNPPFQECPWVLTAGSRARWVGRPLECRLCDEEEQGGERPCFAGSVCEECGAVLDEEGSGHRVRCRARPDDVALT
jgi:hypothetical protein